MQDALVYLVGAGPGDPGLITVAGADALRQADVVVYDYLSNPELLRLCPVSAECIYVGKSGTQHTRTQDQINEILLQKARQGQDARRPWTVVRLKGGDPYVFGRGAEEAQFLRQHNIPFIEIPGITSGIAAPAYAGIPVTHRDFTSTITLITGHERDDAITTGRGEIVPDREHGGERVNYEALARIDGTLVFYMGVKSLPTIVQKLQSHGMPADTPAAVIRWGTRANQQTVTGTLDTIVDLVQIAGIKAPAITVIGKVISLRPTLNWFEERPLFGQRILITRTRQQASELSAKLAALGAQVVEAPTIDILPPEEHAWEGIERHLKQLPAYDWVVFTSANGVRAAWQRLRAMGFDARHFGASSVAAIGSATMQALQEIGIFPDLLPEKFSGEALAAALKQHLGEQEVRGKRFLLLRADIARPILREELEKLGGIVEDVPIYRTARPAQLPSEVRDFLAQPDAVAGAWVTFTSASTANNLWDLLTPQERHIVAAMGRASIGPITSTALEKLGDGTWRPTLEAATHDIPGLVDALRTAARR